MELNIANTWPHRDTMTVEGTAKESKCSGWVTITPKSGKPFTAHWMDVSDDKGRLMTHPNFGASHA